MNKTFDWRDPGEFLPARVPATWALVGVDDHGVRTYGVGALVVRVGAVHAEAEGARRLYVMIRRDVSHVRPTDDEVARVLGQLASRGPFREVRREITSHVEARFFRTVPARRDAERDAAAASA